MEINTIVKIILHIITFSFSFYCLSGLDLSKIMLNTPERGAKGQVLLFMMSMALGYLVAQFLIVIMYRL
ncbi:MAG: DUF1146 domain-containing protein [Erysipelotrichaceae bacterium]|nr:DUF1146 domain-containing protein [Erysipelotrichaceae bacterium]MBQ2213115.1 DUF1146 domain-containing protein [Erysipelotrichaceae bacterium]